MDFNILIAYLEKVPSIQARVASGVFDNGLWWVKFGIDIKNPLAWQVVQELGHVVNYISLDERLPTTFYPVSPPPYLNGGPAEFLSWVIESTATEFSPTQLQAYLEGRLPRPVDDLANWLLEEDIEAETEDN